MNRFPETANINQQQINVGICSLSRDQESLCQAIELSGYRVSQCQLSSPEEICDLKLSPPDLLILNIKTIVQKSHLMDEIIGLNLPFIFYARKNTDPDQIKLSFMYHPFAILILPSPPILMKANIELAMGNKELRLQLRRNELEVQVHDVAPQISLKSGYNTLLLEANEILYGYADHIYTIVVTRDREIITRSSIAKMLVTINSSNCVQIHRRFFVNLDHVVSFDRKAVFIHGKELPIGDSFKNKLKAYLKK